MTELLCRGCGSADVIPNAVIHDYDDSTWRPLSVTIPLANPEPAEMLGITIGSRESRSVPLHARVCGECGLTELYATDPRGTWAAYRGGR